MAQTEFKARTASVWSHIQNHCSTLPPRGVVFGSSRKSTHRQEARPKEAYANSSNQKAIPHANDILCFC